MRSLIVASLAIVGCTNEPVYLPSPTNLEGGMEDEMGNAVEARSSLQIPVVTETMEDRLEREEIQATVDPAVMVPYVRVGDLEISVEWTIRNLTDMPGKATIQLNGANQFFAYDPSLIVLGEADNEEITAPGLAGDVPLDIGPNGELSGVFKEDELREASVDLDMVTRGNVNPYRATLQINKNTQSFEQLTPLMFDEDGEPLPQMGTGLVFPVDAIPQIVRVDLVFKPDRHMVLEYTVRVRDVRHDLIHELGVDALVTAPGELEPLAPAEFTVTP
ncbi:MAG: hypothetical protein SFX73_07625 [Kofleriaceae bacterium]|nr:hypothetical protein [Kofleriaceae bacterium]